MWERDVWRAGRPPHNTCKISPMAPLPRKRWKSWLTSAASAPLCFPLAASAVLAGSQEQQHLLRGRRGGPETGDPGAGLRGAASVSGRKAHPGFFPSPSALMAHYLAAPLPPHWFSPFLTNVRSGLNLPPRRARWRETVRWAGAYRERETLPRPARCVRS